MQPLHKFFGARKTWVLAGKGPSFAARPPVIPYPVLGLNHVCLHLDCDLAHFTDLDAFLQCGEALSRQTCGVALPLYPHVRNGPGRRALDDLFRDTPWLEMLHADGRLYTYNSTLAKGRRDWLSTHTTRYFSAVVGLHILGHFGMRDVYTLGIDGGSAYSPEFDPSTRLANGRDSFDVQFGEMKKIAAKFKMTVWPLEKAK